MRQQGRTELARTSSSCRPESEGMTVIKRAIIVTFGAIIGMKIAKRVNRKMLDHCEQMASRCRQMAGRSRERQPAATA